MSAADPPRFPELYGITSGDGVEPLPAIVAAMAAGLRWVQVRDKSLPPIELFAQVQRVVAVAHAIGAIVLVNDRADIAVAAGADGVHLTEQSLDVTTVRKSFPALIVGVSTHSAVAARRAADLGADFVLFGPVFPTPSKRPYGPALGLPELERAARGIGTPVVAVGGITPDRVGPCLRAGAKGVAAIRALLGNRDPAAAVAAYLAELKRNHSPSCSDESSRTFGV